MAVKGRYSTAYEDTAPSGGISDADILAYVQANINNPSAIAAAAAANGVSMADLSRATNISVADITNYFNNAGVQAPSAGQSAADAAALQAANEAAVQQQAAAQQAAVEAARVAAAAQAAADKAAAEAAAREEAARTAAQQAAAKRAADAAAAAQAAADKAKADAAAQQQAAAAAAKAAADAAAKAQADAQAKAQAKAQADAQAKAQADAQAKAQADAQAKATADAQAKAQADAAAKAQADAQAKAQADAAKAQADAQAKAQADAAAKAQADAAKATTAGIASLPAATKTYTQAEVNQALVDALKNDPNASKADITAAAAGMGISAAQVNAAYSSLPAAAAPAAVTQPAGIASLPAATTQTAATQTAAPMDKAAAIEKITQQILAQGVTSKWKGEGKGSAEANARDMAKIIADTGATDISQFGKVTKTVDAAVQPVYGQGDLVTDNEGQQYYSQKIIGYVDQNGNAIDPNLVKSETVFSGGDAGTSELVYTAPVGKQEVFGNKLTGQEVATTYGERQKGNAFGGTFEGKGNTGYNVQFDAQGNPIFYTTAATSNDLAILMQDLGPIAQIGLAIATGGLSLPQQIAANMAVSVLSGNDIGDAIKNAAVSYVGAQIPGLDFMKDGSSFIKDLGLSADLTNTLTNSFNKAATAGATAALTGNNIVDAALKGAASGGTSGVVNTVLGSIDGFDSLSNANKNLVTTAVTGALSGQTLDKIAISTAIAAGNAAVNDATGGNKNLETQLQNAGLVNKNANTNTNIQNQLDQMLTIDASGAMDINAAAAFAAESGYNKFIFDGGTYTLDNDNSAATISDLENIVKQEAAATKLATTKANLAGGEFAGIDDQIAANAKANNTVIGNAEADNVAEAAYLAQLRNPTGTTFTFGGNTYTTGTSNAAVNQAITDAKVTETKGNIKNSASFNEAYALARKDLPPGTVFEWTNPTTGKTESFVNASKEERPDLNITAADKAIAALNASNLSTKTDASNTVAAQNDTLARIIGSGPNEYASETKKLLAQNEALDLANATQKANAAQAAIESVFGKGTAANVVIQGLSNIQQAAGQTLDFVGGSAAAIGLTGANNTLTNAGQSMTRTGEKMQLESVNEANANVINAVNNAQGLGAKIIAGAKAIYENPLSINMAAIEVLQEALPMGLALKSVKLLGKLGAVGLDMGLNAIESGGAAYNDKYREAIKAGKTEAQADAEGMSAFYIASAVTVATAGVVDTAVINKITKSVEKAATKSATGIAKEGGSEFGEEFLTSAITDYALTGKVDLNKALTQGVVGGFVAGKTTGSIDAASNLSNSVSDVQQTFTQELNDAGLKSFDGSNNISSLVDSKTNTFVASEDVTSTLTNAGLIDTSNIRS
jgi:hypothetical protein